MTLRKELFKNLLAELNSNSSVEEYKYIGTGNPLSSILIIGKEAAIQKGNEQYDREILKNFEFWNSVENYDSENVQENNLHTYSPLYPYKGQILRKDNGINRGTSVTWMKYQKLINLIFDSKHNIKIDFHEKSFITEVNSTPSKITAIADTDSIAFRKKHILSSNYFKSFPIVIISGVGYFENGNGINEIEKIFDVQFCEKKFAIEETQKQPYWIHWNKDKSKLLINTYQLSIGIADTLLTKIAEEIKRSNLLS